MSQPSQNYIDKVIAWTRGGGEVDLARMHMPLAGQFRARLSLECYMLWQQNKTVNVRKIVKNIAARDYATLMANAELGNQEAAEMVAALGIRRDEQTKVVSVRKETEIANDIYVVNQLVGRLSVAKNHIQKAMYEDNIEWLIQFGRKTGNVTAMREAQRNLEKLNNDFKEEQNPADALKPGVERNITGDISIIKPDRTNYTEEELRAFAKKIGASLEEVTDMIEGEDGVFVADADTPADDTDADTADDPDAPADRGSSPVAVVPRDSSRGHVQQPTDEPDTTDPFNT